MARRMCATLARRGPDGDGFFAAEPGVALGHRRLSILDLSEAASQPMTLADSGSTLTFNGEIYNFAQIRRTLEDEGEVFTSSGDTEVLLKALSRWGVEVALAHLEGMFAFAYWDAGARRLIVARDRLGQKPLYYGFVQGCFAFASELRAFEAVFPGLEIDRDSLALCLRYKAIPCPRSAYKEVQKLPPATYAVFDFDAFALSAPTEYWRAISEVTPMDSWSYEEAQAEFSRLFRAATQKRMISDVPLGAFLSGGIDSSLVVAAMVEASRGPVQTFTIGFDDAQYDEAQHAREVARHLGAQHTELYFSEAEVLAQVPSLSQIFDEPFGDSSLLPTQLVSQLARRSVTVALSGDGGDEFFAGYNRHLWLPKLNRLTSGVPLAVRRLVAGLLNATVVRGLLESLGRWGLLKFRTLSVKLDKLVFLLCTHGVEEMYRDVLSDWKEPGELVVDAALDVIDEFAQVPGGLSELERLCRADALFYLPDDILFKVDRASMYHSLEARSPFLDHSLVEFSLSLPAELKVWQGEGKRLSRAMLSTYLPLELFDRPKMGFAVPLAQWLRGPLQEWAQDLFEGPACRSGEYFNRERLQAVWREHLSQQADHSGRLWNVLMILAWLEARK